MERCNNLPTITDIFDSELYIDDEIRKNQKETMDENSLANLSWIESVEQELSSSIDTKTFMCSSDPTQSHSEKYIDIDNLLTCKYDELSDSNIMEYQTQIINYLRKQIKNKIIISDLLVKLNWLIETSKYLSEKLKLQIFQHKNGGTNSVSRSSYKFCNYNFECQFNYNLKKYCGCYAQHYVHNLVYADLESLKMYVLNNEISIECKIEEIKKSINTSSFVIGHMHDELKNAQKFNFFNTLNNHIERTPKKKTNKAKLQIAQI